MEERLKKIIQKRFYDLLSHKNGILLMLAGTFLLTISAFHFGEAWLEWSQDKYEAVFHSYSDNLAEKSFRDRLSTSLPIDVVYTWVNGSDPDLLRQLELVKVASHDSGNTTRERQCTYTNCMCVGLLVSPALPDSLTLEELKVLTLTGEEAWGTLLFTNVTALKEVRQQSDWPANFTQLDLPTEDDVTKLLSATRNHWSFGGVNYTLSRAFYTSDVSLPYGMMVPSVVMMSGYPASYGEEQIKEAASGRVNDTQKFPIEVTIHQKHGISLLQVSEKSQYNILVKDSGLIIDGKTVMFNQAKLVWNLQQDMRDDVIAASRFQDNEELRYSLRSVEKYAPWVRHIYLVTNGQIPYWLNLDNPRLTVITHGEIFVNLSHLPSFSSPAIEAHIHRIPGLSEKFIYLNDDVMFGSPVWPDDFYTHSSGQKVYLTWPVPNCNEGCPPTWIKDGYCDKACNSSECEWDGGDCLGSSLGSVQYGVGFAGDSNTDTNLYCSSGCADTWLSDKYCDQACNNLECGFDTGDCGTANYEKLQRFDLGTDKQHYKAPPGEYLMYFNLTRLVGESGKVTGAKFTPNKAVRVAAVANKFKVMTVVLHQGHNATTVNVSLEYTSGGNASHFLNVSLEVDTSVKRPDLVQVNVEPDEGGNNTASVSLDDMDAGAFTGWAQQQKGPDGQARPLKAVEVAAGEAESLGMDMLYQHYKEIPELPGPMKQKLEELEAAVKEDELTVTGFKTKLAEICSLFRAEVEALRPKLEALKISSERKKNETHVEDQPKQQQQHHEAEEPHQQQQQKHHDQKDFVPPHPALKGAAIGGQDHKKPHQIPAGAFLKGNGTIEGHKQQQQQQHQEQPKQEQKNEQHQAGKRLKPAPMAKKESPDANVIHHQEEKHQEMQQQQQQHQEQPKQKQKNEQHQAGNKLKPAPMAKKESPDANVIHQQEEKHEEVQQPQQHKQNVDTMAHAGADLNNVKSKFKTQGAKNPLPKIVRDHEQKKLVKKDDEHEENAEKDEESPYEVGDRGAGGRKLLASLYPWVSRLTEMGENQHRQTLVKMKQERKREQMSEADFLRLVSVGETRGEGGTLPWEREQKFDREPEKAVANEYIVEGWQGRQLLDTFGDSLRHVNSLYNKEFGFASRKVPAHMPHFIDKKIMEELQQRFPHDWEETSSHRIRSSTDMQYSFSYFYYLMGVTDVVPVESVFDDVDTDLSGVLSDREIRTLATRLYDLPLYLETLTGLEDIFKNCSQHDESDPVQLPEALVESYYDKDMPQVTRTLFTTCEQLIKVVQEKFKPQPKYKTVEMDESHVAFKMIHTNVSLVVGQLDDVRKHPKKFICLNDNIEHSREEAKTVKAVLQDFYESMFPKPSQFELQREYRNRFLHMDQLTEWRTYRDRLRLFTHFALSLLIILTVASFFGDKIESWRHRLAKRRSPHRQRSSSPSSSSSSLFFLSSSSLPSSKPDRDSEDNGRATPPSSISTSGPTHLPVNQGESDSSCVLWPSQGAVDTV